MKKTLILSAAVAALALGAFYGRALAQASGAAIEAAVVRLVNSTGGYGWRARDDSNNRLVVENLDSAQVGDAVEAAVRMDKTVGGAVRLSGYTSTQISTLTPPASGYVILNISIPNLCVSTGTTPTAGAWVQVSSRTVMGSAGLQVPCY